MSASLLRYYLLLVLLVGSRVGAWAQTAGVATTVPAPAWPRDSTGQVSFRGLLPWPDSVRDEAGRQALVHRWFLAHLTDMEAARQDYVARQSGTAFGRVPRAASLRLDTHDQEGNDELYQLVYQLDFLSTPTGLAYQLTDFEVLYADAETGGDQPLEDVLAATQGTQTQQALAMLRQRLAQALAGW